MLAPSKAKITLAENGELALSYFNNSIDFNGYSNANYGWYNRDKEN